MNIVVLDGYTLNPGDLSWSPVEALGELTVHDRMPEPQIVERARDAQIVFTNKTPISDATMAQLPELRYIGVLATGYNIVDVDAARARGIVVTNIPTYGTRSVGQMVFALLLEMCHHVQAHSDAVRSGRWTASSDFCFWDYPLIELAGKTMGIIGFGRIGQQTADIARAFGMNVLGYDASPTDQSGRADFRWAEFDELMRESDAVSLHCPLLPETRGIINRDALKLMKKTAFLINTARGPLVNEQDLADALNRGTIAGAALDVLSEEPPRANNPLLSTKNCLITPHISWATKEARARLMDIAADNLKAFLAGKPVNAV